MKEIYLKCQNINNNLIKFFNSKNTKGYQIMDKFFKLELLLQQSMKVTSINNVSLNNV